MIVPDMSQLIDGLGGDRCGETSLSACLASFKHTVSVHDICDYLQVPFDNAKSTVYQLIDAAHHFGAYAQLLNSENDCITALNNQHAVIVELYNALLNPLPYPAQPGWYGNHFVVLEKLTNDDKNSIKTATIMDPLSYPNTQQNIVTYQSFIDAVHAVPIIPWGLSVWYDIPKKVVVKTGPKPQCLK